MLNSEDVELKPKFSNKELHVIEEIEDEGLESSVLNNGYQSKRKSSFRINLKGSVCEGKINNTRSPERATYDFADLVHSNVPETRLTTVRAQSNRPSVSDTEWTANQSANESTPKNRS
jgi:hypothetical protein